MIINLLKLLTFSVLLFCIQTQAQEIWIESFSIPNKGVWGDEDGSTIHQNFEGITTWTIEYPNTELTGPDDYAKTTTTSGGRFECRDTDGEVIWRSEKINIEEFKEIRIQLKAIETGSGANEQNKYLKAFYMVNDGGKFPFETNGVNRGNWGSSLAEQTNIEGETLQIIVYLNNHYSSDKVILDEVVVTGKEEIIPFSSGDIVINEVMFNPFPGANDYVELYNNSDIEIPTNQLFLASYNNNLEPTQVYQLSKKRLIFQPYTYLALTKDTNGVFPWFTINRPECFLQMEKFPSYNNDEDHVVLLNTEMEIIDELHYFDNFHHPMLADEEGIALERMSFSAPTNTPNNWHSASTESGYGTPGYKNSQGELENQNKPTITFSPESFSPNSDGYNDEFRINYKLEKPGYVANVWIFDSAGRAVMQLSKNEILGTSGKITWNGEDETGQRQALGVYIVVVEIFDTQGNVYRFKDGVVLTGILN